MMRRSIILMTTIVFMWSCDTAQKEPQKKVPQEKATATYISTDEYKAQNLPFSQAVIFDNVIYVSGHVGEINQKLVEGGIGPETRQAMESIKKILEANGSSMDNVIKCTCMLQDIGEWAAMNEVYRTYFPNNKPARSALGASGLALGARVEIECMAYVNGE